MYLKELSVRCSAITHTTARAFGIVQAMGPKLPSAHRARASRASTQQSGKRSRFGPHPLAEHKLA